MFLIGRKSQLIFGNNFEERREGGFVFFSFSFLFILFSFKNEVCTCFFVCFYFYSFFLLFFFDSFYFLCQFIIFVLFVFLFFLFWKKIISLSPSSPPFILLVSRTARSTAMSACSNATGLKELLYVVKQFSIFFRSFRLNQFLKFENQISKTLFFPSFSVFFIYEFPQFSLNFL